MMSMHPQAPVPIAGNADTAQVDRLLRELQTNLEEARLSLNQQEELLSQVKVIGRDPAAASQIFSKEGITTLSKYGLEHGSSSASREALRCLANALLLNEPSRQTFVDLGFATKAAERLVLDDLDDEFLLSRILFLLTYNTRIDFVSLSRSKGLVETIVNRITQHAKAYSKSAAKIESNRDMAMAETLKLLFNISHYYPSLVSEFTPVIEPLLSILLQHTLLDPPLQSPITYVLNALLNLDLKSAEKRSRFGREAVSSPLFPYSDPDSVIGRLADIFDRALRQQPERELDQAAAPLCTLLRKIYSLADSQIRSRMRWLMLPRESDRVKPLGQNDTLAARLLQSSVSPKLPTLRDNISNLLFEMSDKDAQKFIHNIGYGYASGFLMSHNIPVPSTAETADSTSSPSQDTASGADVNPITGQKLSAEDQSTSQQDMTEEEKEREAERLFVLFERLKATGVVKVKNPVEQAVEEGRFEEVDD